MLILIDPFDPMKLANVILELSTNKSYRQKLIERGKKEPNCLLMKSD